LVREPQLSTRALLELSCALRVLTQARGIHLLISDRLDLALAVQADGVQLPEVGFPPAVARRLLGADALIGVSRHSRTGLLEAAAEGADYATLSPLHAVEGKAPALEHVGFAEALLGPTPRASTPAAPPLPVYALGGVRVADVQGVLASGARGVAVMREVLSAADPAASARGLLAALGER
jgi:thiamine-phosphate pyrophosphorylase